MSRPLAGLLGDVRAASAFRYDARDSAGNRMDTAKVIGDPAGGYLAVYHSGEVCHLATSSDLMEWAHRAVVDEPATQPTIASTGDAGVERLLGSIPPNLRLLHLCGEHRVEPHAAQAVTAVPVYRSNALPMPDDFRRIEGQVAAVHSPRAGQRLGELADQAGIDRSTVRIAAISEAAASAAGAGWERCEAAATPDEAALLALAARLCDNRPQT